MIWITPNKKERPAGEWLHGPWLAGPDEAVPRLDHPREVVLALRGPRHQRRLRHGARGAGEAVVLQLADLRSRFGPPRMLSGAQEIR